MTIAIYYAIEFYLTGTFAVIRHPTLSTDSFQKERAGKFSFIMLEISHSFDNGWMEKCEDGRCEEMHISAMLLMRFFFPAGITPSLLSFEKCWCEENWKMMQDTISVHFHFSLPYLTLPSLSLSMRKIKINFTYFLRPHHHHHYNNNEKFSHSVVLPHPKEKRLECKHHWNKRF